MKKPICNWASYLWLFRKAQMHQSVPERQRQLSEWLLLSLGSIHDLNHCNFPCSIIFLLHSFAITSLVMCAFTDSRMHVLYPELRHCIVHVVQSLLLHHPPHNFYCDASLKFWHCHLYILCRKIFVSLVYSCMEVDQWTCQFNSWDKKLPLLLSMRWALYVLWFGWGFF